MIGRSWFVASAVFATVVVAGCSISTTPAADTSPAQTGASSQAQAPAGSLARLGQQLQAGPPQDVPTVDELGPLPTALYRVPTTDKVVFITIDDGYSQPDGVAKLLAETGLPITAFLTADTVESHTKYFAGISAADGQTIQNHSRNHPQMPNLSDANQEEQICYTNDMLTKWFGAKPWMFRPPYGEFNDSTKAAAKACGIDYLVLWKVSLPGAYLRYAEGDKLQSGDIILTHWRDDLPDHLQRSLRRIAAQGFKVAALQDYLPRRG